MVPCQSTPSNNIAASSSLSSIFHLPPPLLAGYLPKPGSKKTTIEVTGVHISLQSLEQHIVVGEYLEKRNEEDPRRRNRNKRNKKPIPSPAQQDRATLLLPVAVTIIGKSVSVLYHRTYHRHARLDWIGGLSFPCFRWIPPIPRFRRTN